MVPSEGLASTCTCTVLFALAVCPRAGCSRKWSAHACLVGLGTLDLDHLSLKCEFNDTSIATHQLAWDFESLGFIGWEKPIEKIRLAPSRQYIFLRSWLNVKFTCFKIVLKKQNGES